METVTFEQVVSRGCGLDVHKETVVATIDGEGIERTTREFGTFTRSLTELKDWLVENKITHVAMESTGVYWKPVYNILEPTGITVWIVNARHVKNVPGHKTDKKDSRWLCKLLLAGLLKPSYIPPREQRELRAAVCGDWGFVAAGGCGALGRESNNLKSKALALSLNALQHSQIDLRHLVQPIE